jgi:hypothetical protein
MGKTHVFPLKIDLNDIQRTGYGPDERIVKRPLKDCALCRINQCEQVEDGDGLIIHAKPAPN